MAIYQGSKILSGGASPFSIAEKAGFEGTEAEFNELLANIDEVANKEDLTNHINDKNNPHGVTAAQINAAPADHTHDEATTSATGFMSASDKTKLDGIEADANKTTVDSALSSSSTNPVQNKAVSTALDGKVPTTRTVNGKALSSNITLSADDIGAAGRKTTGTVYTINGAQVTAGTGAEAFNTTTNKASGIYSHAEGVSTTASGYASHAEGDTTTASGARSHAEGSSTIASGNTSHAEGWHTTASGPYSHVEGTATIASGQGQHVQGKYNVADTTSAHIVGNGSSDTARSNSHTLDNSGNAWFAGDVYVGSTSGTNKDAGSVKLSKEGHTHTAEQVGARSNTWLPTPVDIGAAPAGYGLGSFGKYIPATVDINTVIECGWYYWTNPPINGIGAWCTMEISSLNDGHLTQQIYNYTTKCEAIRHCVGSKWSDWEWVNPPMDLNKEYRTTERITNKAVYKRNNNGVIQYRLDGETEWKNYAGIIGAAPASHSHSMADITDLNVGGGGADILTATTSTSIMGTSSAGSGYASFTSSYSSIPGVSISGTSFAIPAGYTKACIIVHADLVQESVWEEPSIQILKNGSSIRSYTLSCSVSVRIPTTLSAACAVTSGDTISLYGLAPYGGSGERTAIYFTGITILLFK